MLLAILRLIKFLRNFFGFLLLVLLWGSGNLSPRCYCVLAIKVQPYEVEAFNRLCKFESFILDRAWQMGRGIDEKL